MLRTCNNLRVTPFFFFLILLLLNIELILLTIFLKFLMDRFKIFMKWHKIFRIKWNWSNSLEYLSMMNVLIVYIDIGKKPLKINSTKASFASWSHGFDLTTTTAKRIAYITELSFTWSRVENSNNIYLTSFDNITSCYESRKINYCWIRKITTTYSPFGSVRSRPH